MNKKNKAKNKSKNTIKNSNTHLVIKTKKEGLYLKQ